MADESVFAVRQGWKLRRTKVFAESFDALELEVAQLAEADPVNYLSHPKVKLFIRISDLILEEIPLNPNAPEYALGNSLGPSRRHWRRAKFLQRFRLFYRFDSASRTIVYGWMNDENTLRKAGSKSDPYAVFLRRLDRGEPPDDWKALMKNSEGAD
jgi:toxin YhaV